MFNLLGALVIPFNMIWYMTMFWKVEFWPPGFGWMAACLVFATMMLHSWFHLIWYATWTCSETVEFQHFDPTLSPPRGSNPGFGTIIKFDMFHIYCTSACMPNFIKTYWHLRELVRNLQSNLDGSNWSGPSVRVRPIHVFERYLALVHVYFM